MRARVTAACAAFAVIVAGLVALPATAAQAEWGESGIDVQCNNASLYSAFQAGNNAWVNSWVTINLSPGCTYTLTDPWRGAYYDSPLHQIDPYQGEAYGLPTLHTGVGYSRLIVNGDGATIQRDPNAPRFRFISLDDFAYAQFNNLTFKNGAAPHGEGQGGENPEYCDQFNKECGADIAPGGDGGAILNWGNLTLNNVTFVGNDAGNGENGNFEASTDAASGGNGGAIYNLGTLTITNSDFATNSAGDGGNGGDSEVAHGGNGGNGGYGGAIYNRGGLAITDTTFTGNIAGTFGSPGNGLFGHGSYGDWGNGGAITTDTSMSVSRSLLQNNSAGQGTGGEGGAVYSTGGQTVIESSTLDGNYAGQGGAFQVDFASVVARSDTFTGNSDGATSGGADVAVADYGGSAEFDSSALIGNGTGADCAVLTDGAAAHFSTDGALYENENGAGCGATAEGNFQVGPLQDNGGATLSRMPTGSLLGAANTCPAVDQRNLPRRATGCDIGSVETQSVTSISPVTGNNHVPAWTVTQYTTSSTANLPLQYHWWVTGVTAAIDDDSAASPHIEFTAPGDAIVHAQVRITGVPEADGTWIDVPPEAVHVGHTPDSSPVVTFTNASSEAAKHQGDTGHYTYTVSDQDGDQFAMVGSPTCGTGATLTASSYDVTAHTGTVDCSFPVAPAQPVIRVAFQDEWGAQGNGIYTVSVHDVDPVVTLNGPYSVNAGDTATYTFSITYSGSYPSAPAASCMGDSTSPGIHLVPSSLTSTTVGFVTTGTFQCTTAVGDDGGYVSINAGDAGFANRSLSVNSPAPVLSISSDVSSQFENGSVAQVTFHVYAHDPSGYTMFPDQQHSVCNGGTLLTALPQHVADGTTDFVCAFGPGRGDYGFSFGVSDGNHETLQTLPFTIINVEPTVTVTPDSGDYTVNEYSSAYFHWTAVDPGLQTIIVDLPTSCVEQGSPARNGEVTTGAFRCDYDNGPASDTRALWFSDYSDYTEKVAVNVTENVVDVAPVLSTTIGPSSFRLDQGVESVTIHWSTDLVGRADRVGDVTINWGDGTSSDLGSSFGIDTPYTHSYPYAGNFVLTIDVTKDGTPHPASPLDAQGHTTFLVNVTPPPLSVSAPSSVPEGQLTTITATLPAGWAGAYAVDATSCGTDEHGDALAATNLVQNATTATFDCDWRYRDGETQQVSLSAHATAGGPDSTGTATVTVTNVAPVITWTTVPTDVHSGTADYEFDFSATDPSGIDWLNAALSPAASSPEVPAVSCGSEEVVVTPTRYDPVTGTGSIVCRFPSGGATERLVVTLVDPSGGRGSATLDVPVVGTATAVSVELSPAPTSVDEGSDLVYDYAVQGDGAASLFDITLDCGAGNTVVSGATRLTGDADDHATGTFECRFADGPSTASATITATTDGVSGSDSATVTVNDVAPSYADFPGVQHVTNTSGVHVPVGTFTDPGQDPVSNVRLDTVQYYWGGLGYVTAPFFSNYGSNPAVIQGGINLPTLPPGETNITLTITNDDGTFVETRVLTTLSVYLTTPGNQSAEATSSAGAHVAFPAATAEDTATGDPIAPTCDWASGDLFPLGATTVTCTATGSDSTVTTKTFQVVVADTTKPDVTATADAASFEAGSGGVATIGYTASAHDAIDGDLAVTCTVPNGQAEPIGTTSITCSATDTSGNTGTATFDVVVADTTAPTVTLNPDVPDNGTITASAYDSSGAWVYRPGYRVHYQPPDPSTPTATAYDTVDGGLAATCDNDFDYPTVTAHFPIGSTTVTCSATDAHGNVGTATFVVEVSDTTAPTLGVSDQAAEATGPTGAPVTFSGVTATDNVDGDVTPDCAPASGSTFPLGSTTVSCTATDAAGNTSDAATFQVVVTNTTAPTIAAPDVTVDATGPTGAAVEFAPTAFDFADGATDPVDCAPPSGTTFPIGATTVDCTTTDSAGLAGSGAFTVRVVDGAPVIAVPDNFAVAATGTSGAPVAFTVTAHDAVDGDLTPACATASGAVESGDTFPLGATTVTCSATDSASNVGSASFTVTVADGTAPTVAVPDNITAEATGPHGAAVTFSASAIDGIDGPVDPTCSPASGATFALGHTTVTCSATDSASNTGSATFTVAVQDTTAPTVTVPGAIHTTATSAGGAKVAFHASSTDLVDGTKPATCAPASGSTFSVGTTTVTCGRMDAAGNRATTKTFTVTVAPLPAHLVAPTSPLPAPTDGSQPTPPPTATPTPTATPSPTTSPAEPGNAAPQPTASTAATEAPAIGDLWWLLLVLLLVIVAIVVVVIVRRRNR